MNTLSTEVSTLKYFKKLSSQAYYYRRIKGRGCAQVKYLHKIGFGFKEVRGIREKQK